MISPPKRRGDRVAELEAQVASLTRLLELQNIGTPSSTATDPPRVFPASTDAGNPATSVSQSQKKRKLPDDPLETSCSNPIIKDTSGIELDAVISQDLQQHVLQKYLNELVPGAPIVPASANWTFDRLRKEKPVLFQAIVYAASPGLLSIELQEDIAKIVMDLFATRVISEGQRNVELLQAVLVATMWHRIPRHHTHLASFELLQLAPNMAQDIGLGSASSSCSLGYSKTDRDSDSADGVRAWFSCHLLAASSSVLMRKPNALKWTEQDESGLQLFQYSHYQGPNDCLLSRYLRTELLCEHIASKLQFFQPAAYADISDPVMVVSRQTLQNQITDWQAQLPSSNTDCGLRLLEHVPTLYLHESVLHTPTNKSSFTAPFLAEKLSVTDFPAPIITPEHITSLYALLSACHIVIDRFTTLDVSTMIVLPAFLFASRVLYAGFLLAKLYVATSAPNNTFGAVLDPELLYLDDYLDKIIAASVAVKATDERCGPARILSAATRLREWVGNYRLRYARQDEEFAGAMVALPSGDAASNDWLNAAFDNETLITDLDWLEPQANGWLTEPFPYNDVGLLTTSAVL